MVGDRLEQKMVWAAIFARDNSSLCREICFPISIFLTQHRSLPFRRKVLLPLLPLLQQSGTNSSPSGDGDEGNFQSFPGSSGNSSRCVEFLPAESWATWKTYERWIDKYTPGKVSIDAARCNTCLLLVRPDCIKQGRAAVPHTLLYETARNVKDPKVPT